MSSSNTTTEDYTTVDQQISSFLSDCLSDADCTQLELQLTQFVSCHYHQRPIALVTSGGTAADLEVNSVRCLDNFSTGLRGAISVEEFLKRGYAVVHLWRRGSASPFGRVLCQEILQQPAQDGLHVDSLGKLFAGGDEDDEEALVQQVLDQQDPWLTDPNNNNNNNDTAANNAHTMNRNDHHHSIALHRHVLYSTKLQTALQERATALKEQRLLTIPFRSIEEYLAKLKLASTALQESKSLALVYLAAAVSDYYIPQHEKSQHKIQSDSGSITLHLRPVPKTMGLLRDAWAPDAFCVSFKLETDSNILRKKAERAVQKYNCHLVIGNLLHTRYQKVSILAPPELGNHTTDVTEWPMHEVVKPHPQQQQDSLESAIIDFVVQSHFEFISNSGYQQQPMQSSKAAMQRLQEKKWRLQRQSLELQLKQHAWTVAGIVLSVALSSAISAAMQRRAAGQR
ncbi:Phosphopantothenate--cysteine ligase 1 [Seminavis robusta]|uniref:Phosphopantothenate--cysteine ligase 1 n=1 Tax=Seminavis robusta TaxID=568900 RepID=A0A9N8DEB0_9STRA|nr:Phosphopantothenate--cysteine ligase 1 [Seminavis robusta]|eukprot:Sro49_g028550.1 Phosphopantothenate--cysteine ligase 1 (455) ;mRNA; f:25855-27219